MRARCISVLNKLAGLPGLRLVPWKDRKWQESSAVSACFWILNSYIIFRLAEYFGQGVIASIVVSLFWDALTFAVNKFWIWRKCNITLGLCYSRNFVVWLAFFGINAGLFWMLNNPGSLSVHHTRYILGALGIAINPWRFQINKKRIFEDVKTVTE